MDSKQEILVRFGERVREIRNEKKLSQEKLGFKANLHRTYIGMVERAEKNITLVNIEKIANALEVNINELFLWQSKKNSDSKPQKEGLPKM